MKTKCFFIVSLIVWSNTTIAQMPDSVKSYIDTAIHLMQTRSLNGKRLDWKAIKDSVYRKARDAKNYKEIFPAIVYAFQQLKDYHGMVANEDTFYRYPPL